MRPYACMSLGGGQSKCGATLRLHADWPQTFFILADLAQGRVGGKPFPLHPRMVARGGRTRRGGRSLATIISSWELRLAETADYLLRAVLGLEPRPQWGLGQTPRPP